MFIFQLKDDEEGEEEIHALQELYEPGQHVVCSIVSIEKVNNMTKGDSDCSCLAWEMCTKSPALFLWLKTEHNLRIIM